MLIREFKPTDTEYRAIYAVEKAVYPENATTVDGFKHHDASLSEDFLFQRFVVEREGQLIAFASIARPPQAGEPGRYNLNITVHPDFERRGLGTAVYDYLIQALRNLQPRPTLLAAGCYQHHRQAVRFLRKRGFRQVMRWVITRLDIQAFEPHRFQPLLEKLAAQGIERIAMPELQKRVQDWLGRLHELDWLLAQDEPQPFSPKKMSQAQFKQWFVDNPQVIPDAWFIALGNGRYLGYSSLEKGSQPGVLSTGYTGVVREYRRRGLATALKVEAIAYAKAAGYKYIRTGNEENNPMLALNRKLGFTELTASLAFEKRLDNGEAK